MFTGNKTSDDMTALTTPQPRTISNEVMKEAARSSPFRFSLERSFHRTLQRQAVGAYSEGDPRLIPAAVPVRRLVTGCLAATALSRPIFMCTKLFVRHMGWEMGLYCVGVGRW